MTTISSSRVKANFAGTDQPPQLAHTVIRASAGSGKTHALTNRYLQLLAHGAEPATMFASTFTRLAAGEISDRILRRLVRAAGNDKQRIELARELGLTDLSRQDVVALLARLAQRMHLMQVRTLDSFFAGIVHAFAIELDAPLGAAVADESREAAMRGQAIAALLDEHEPQKLVDLLRWLTQGASDRGITKVIDKVVKDLHGLYRETEAVAWDCVPHLEGSLPPPRLVAAIERLVQASPRSNPSLIEAHKADCDQARDWNWSGFLKDGLAKVIAAGKSQYKRQRIDEGLAAAYEPLVRHAIAELVRRAREQTLATRDLLALFDRAYEHVKRGHGAVTFDDLTFAMARAVKLGTIDEIAFRLDGKLRHVMLDEFQDTSVPQWRALEPMIDEIVSVAPPERTLFCVGDAKQSIYGWRDAAPEVLEQLPRMFAGQDGSSAIAVGDLARSYRSSPIVIGLVNEVFGNLAHNAALSDYSDASAAWSRAFVHHETEKAELAGYAELRFCDRAGDRKKSQEVRFREAAALAAEIHRRNPRISIGVLTRTNEAVADLLFELGPSCLNVPASGRGGGPLTDAAPVNVILDLLQLADHPDDTIAAFHVANSPAGAIVGLSQHDDVRARRTCALRIRRELVAQGYARTISLWARDMAPACDARELRRLRQLVELAEIHDSRPTLRTNDFIKMVEQRKVADTGPAPIQVMTIHQSKGLEFDAVILPELESRLKGGQAPVVFERSPGRGGAAEIGPIARICRYMNDEVLELVPPLAPLFDAHKRRCVRESLSLLYVATTRARQGLYLLIDAPQINKNGSISKVGLKSPAGILRSALAAGKSEPGKVHFWQGDAKWIEQAATSGEITVDAPAGQIELAKPRDDARARRGWAHAAASSLPPDSRLRKELRLPNLDSRERGLAIHAMFQQIEWIETFTASDDELSKIALAKAPRRNRDWAARQVADFRRMIRNAQVRNALAQPSAGSTHQLERERAFARLVDGRIQTGYIDRLVIERDRSGRIMRATLDDFKTDEVSDASAAAVLAEAYRPQLETYRKAATAMHHIDVAAVVMRILFVEPGLVINL